MLFIAHQFQLVSKSGQLFIHVCLLGSDFVERKLTGRKKKCKQNRQRALCCQYLNLVIGTGIAVTFVCILFVLIHLYCIEVDLLCNNCIHSNTMEIYDHSHCSK